MTAGTIKSVFDFEEIAQNKDWFCTTVPVSTKPKPLMVPVRLRMKIVSTQVH